MDEGEGAEPLRYLLARIEEGNRNLHMAQCSQTWGTDSISKEVLAEALEPLINPTTGGAAVG